MAALETSYDLSGGEQRTTNKITGGTYIQLQAFLTTASGKVTYKLQKRNSTSGDWIDLKNANGEKKLVFHTNNSAEDGLDVVLAGGDVEYSVNIIPGDNTTGTLTLDAVTDGTIEAI